MPKRKREKQGADQGIDEELTGIEKNLGLELRSEIFSQVEKSDRELCPDDPFDRAAFQRRVAAPGDYGLVILSAEDTIVDLLRWTPFSGHQTGVEDVRDIIAIHRECLDLTYIRAWCDGHGTRALFEELLREEAHLPAFAE